MFFTGLHRASYIILDTGRLHKGSVVLLRSFGVIPTTGSIYAGCSTLPGMGVVSR